MLHKSRAIYTTSKADNFSPAAKPAARPILTLKGPVPKPEKSAPETTVEAVSGKTMPQERPAPNVKPDIITPKSTAKKKDYILPKEEFTRIFSLAKEKCPELFGPEVKLLKIGIRSDLSTALELPLGLTSKFLKIYCGSPAYLKLQLPGNKRYDLTGLEAGEVSGKEAENSAKSLAKLKERKNLRKLSKSKKLSEKAEKKAAKKDTPDDSSAEDVLTQREIITEPIIKTSLPQTS